MLYSEDHSHAHREYWREIKRVLAREVELGIEGRTYQSLTGDWYYTTGPNGSGEIKPLFDAAKTAEENKSDV